MVNDIAENAHGFTSGFIIPLCKRKRRITSAFLFILLWQSVSESV